MPPAADLVVRQGASMAPSRQSPQKANSPPTTASKSPSQKQQRKKLKKEATSAATGKQGAFFGTPPPASNRTEAIDEEIREEDEEETVVAGKTDQSPDVKGELEVNETLEAAVSSESENESERGTSPLVRTTNSETYAALAAWKLDANPVVEMTEQPPAQRPELQMYRDLPLEPAPDLRHDVCVTLGEILRCSCLGIEPTPPRVPPSGFGEVKRLPVSCVPRYMTLGLTIDGLREWLAGLLPPQGNGTPGSAGWAVGHPNGYDAQQHANLESALDGRSVCERLGLSWPWEPQRRHVGQASVYVCWPLSAPLATLVLALERFVAQPARDGGPAPRSRADTYFWICCCSLRMHSPQPVAGCVSAAASETALSEEHALYMRGLGVLIETIEHTVVLLEDMEDPQALNRTHCLRELWLSIKRHARVDLILGTSASERFELAFGREFRPVRTLLQTLGAVDLWDSTCFSDDDYQYTIKAAQYYLSPEGLPLSRTRREINQLLAKTLRQAYIRFSREVLAHAPPLRSEVTGRMSSHLGALVKESELVMLRESLGDKHPSTTRAINALAGMHKSNGELALAYPLYKEALDTRRELLGINDPATHVSLNNLGALLYEQGDLLGAQVYLEECLVARKRELGPIAPDTLSSLHRLGVLHRAKGDYMMACSYLEQSLEGRRLVLGGKHVATLHAMNDLGSAMYDSGLHEPAATREVQMEEAFKLYREALAMCKDSLGESHPLTLTSRNNLGNLRHARALLMPKFIVGRGANEERGAELRAAVKLLRASLASSQALHGATHLETLIATSNLGSALRTLGAEPGLSDAPAITSEAGALIKDAVEGIADSWAAEVAKRPRLQDVLRPGLEDVLMNRHLEGTGLSAAFSTLFPGALEVSRVEAAERKQEEAEEEAEEEGTGLTETAGVPVHSNRHGFDAGGAFLRGLLFN